MDLISDSSTNNYWTGVSGVVKLSLLFIAVGLYQAEQYLSWLFSFPVLISLIPFIFIPSPVTFWPEQSSVRSVQLYQSQQSQTFHFANLWSFNCTVFKLGHCIFLACLIYTFLVVGIGVGWKTVIIKLLQFQLQAELSLAKRKLWQVNTWNCEIWLLQTVKIRNLWIWYWERRH